MFASHLILSRVAVSAVASGCFCLPILWLGPVPMAVVVPAALLIYVAALFAFRDVRRAELSVATQWVVRRLKSERAVPQA